MTATNTSERGLERRICTALAGHPCEPPASGTTVELHAGYGGVGWSGGNFHDYDREYCVDLAQLSAFLCTTQPKAAELLRLSAVLLDELLPSQVSHASERYKKPLNSIGCKNIFYLTGT